MAHRSQKVQLIQAAKWDRDRLLWFLSKRPAHGDGRSEVDIGRCEPRGGAPRPPPQPTGPMGPLGSRPAHLAPRRAVQAPTPRPIQPGFTTWRPQNPSIMAPARPTYAPKTVVGGPYAPWGPLGSLGWRGLCWFGLYAGIPAIAT